MHGFLCVCISSFYLIFHFAMPCERFNFLWFLSISNDEYAAAGITIAYKQTHSVCPSVLNDIDFVITLQSTPLHSFFFILFSASNQESFLICEWIRTHKDKELYCLYLTNYLFCHNRTQLSHYVKWQSLNLIRTLFLSHTHTHLLEIEFYKFMISLYVVFTLQQQALGVLW